MDRRVGVHGPPDECPDDRAAVLAPDAPRGPSARLVVGVEVVLPRGDDEVTLLDHIAEQTGQLVLVLGDGTVGDGGPDHVVDADAEHGQSLSLLLTPSDGELLSVGDVIGGFPVGHSDNGDRDPTATLVNDQAAGAEHFVVRVRAHDDGPHGRR